MNKNGLYTDDEYIRRKQSFLSRDHGNIRSRPRGLDRADYVQRLANCVPVLAQHTCVKLRTCLFCGCLMREDQLVRHTMIPVTRVKRASVAVHDDCYQHEAQKAQEAAHRPSDCVHCDGG